MESLILKLSESAISTIALILTAVFLSMALGYEFRREGNPYLKKVSTPSENKGAWLGFFCFFSFFIIINIDLVAGPPITPKIPPSACPDSVNLAPWIDPVRKPVITQEVSTPDSIKLDSTELKNQENKAIAAAKIKVLNSYSICCGINADLIASNGLDIIDFMTVLSRVTCYFPEQKTRILRFYIAYDPSPIKRLNQNTRIEVPETSSGAVEIPEQPSGMAFGGDFPLGHYKIRGGQRAYISLLAENLFEQLKNKTSLTVTCIGYTCDKSIKGEGIEYAGGGQYHLKWDAIQIGAQVFGSTPLPNKLNINHQLSYARAWEGIQCLKKSFELLDPQKKHFNKIKFLYKGSPENLEDQPRRIEINYKFI